MIIKANSMITTKIEQLKDVDINKISEFLFNALQAREHKSAHTLDSIRDQFGSYFQQEDWCSIAMMGSEIVGWMFLFHYTDSMIYIESWHPVVAPGPDESKIAIDLIKESVKYARSSGKDRMEVFLMDLTEDRRSLYEKYRHWYETAGMPLGGEWAYMEASVSEMEIPDVEFPEGHTLVLIKDVPNEEIWPCYYETFMSSGDGRFLDQTDAQRKENFEKFFDKSRSRVENASILVKYGERIIGYNQIIIIEEGGFFNGIGIHPDFRGKGLGKKMILTSMKRAAESGVSKLILEVDIENKMAINLYEKVGFKQTKGSISHVWKRGE